MPTIDRRTVKGKELAARLNRETVLANMPKVWFLADLAYGRYRVGRTDWAPDTFELIPAAEFETFKAVYERLNMPLLDMEDAG